MFGARRGKGGPDARTVLRYALMQLPGIALAISAAIIARNWFDIGSRAAFLAVALWVLKDIAMFPLVWRAYAPGPQSGPFALDGRSGIAQERLAPTGWVRIGPELWRARAVGKSIEAGARVRVLSLDGFCLCVKEIEAGEAGNADAQ